MKILDCMYVQCVLFRLRIVVRIKELEHPSCELCVSREWLTAHFGGFLSLKRARQRFSYTIDQRSNPTGLGTTSDVG
jgi:hypothetical protein